MLKNGHVKLLSFKVMDNFLTLFHLPKFKKDLNRLIASSDTKVIKSFQTSKCPGSDGLRTEFYQTFM